MNVAFLTMAICIGLSMFDFAVGRMPDNDAPAELDPLPEEMLPRERLGSLFLALSKTTLAEGENADVVVLLRNEVDGHVAGIAPFKCTVVVPGGAALELLVRQLKDNRPLTSVDLVPPENQRISDKRPYPANEFGLAPGEFYGQALMLSELMGDSGTVAWLEPGRYLIQAVYRSEPGHLINMTAMRVAWDRPLVSGGVVLTIEPPTPELAQITADVHKFMFMRGREDFAALRNEYQHLLARNPPAPLQKRVIWHYAQQQHQVNPNEALIALDRFKQMDLTPAEEAAMHEFRGELLFMLNRRDEARAAFKRVNSQRARFMTEALKPEE